MDAETIVKCIMEKLQQSRGWTDLEEVRSGMLNIGYLDGTENDADLIAFGLQNNANDVYEEYLSIHS